MSPALFPTPRDAALALLNSNARLTRKAGSFLGQLCTDPTPMTDAQASWLATLLERAELPHSRRNAMTQPLNYADGGAGHRGIDTLIEGAGFIHDALPRLQRDVLAVIVAAGAYGATGDEIAAVLGWDRFRVRPRRSELRVAYKIKDSGRRRKSDAGVSSIVWVLWACEVSA